MSNVVRFTGITKLDEPCDRILEDATKANLDEVVVIGYAAGDFYFASSVADGGTVVWMLELAKKRLLEQAS